MGVGPVELDGYGVTLLIVDTTTLISNTLITGGVDFMCVRPGCFFASECMSFQNPLTSS